MRYLGDAVSLYGPVSSNGAAYTVQLDNAGTQYFNSSGHYYTPQVLLYQAANLGLGEHKLKVAYQPDTDSGNLLVIDYATVYTTIDSNSNSRHVFFLRSYIASQS